MLSVASVRSSSGAASYFANDNYYANEESLEHSEWGGEGARELGLDGPVEHKDFKNVLEGIRPDTGEGVGQVKDRRSGIDLTFSAPKTVSLLYLVGGDQRIGEAQLNAVRSAMSFIERTSAEGRKLNPETGKMEPVRTGNLVYALFEHDTSRALDPQAHVHAVIANMTKVDGKWQAVHNDSLWKNNTTIGAVYHAALREELHKLGYQTEITGKHGQFEIEGISRDVIDAYSQRRTEILEKINELGIKTPEGRNAVTVGTRDNKIEDVDRAELKKEWVERAAALGFNPSQHIDQAIDRAKSAPIEKPTAIEKMADIASSVSERIEHYLRPADPLTDNGLSRILLSPSEMRTQIAVASSIRILEEREAAFKSGNLVERALNIGLKGVTGDSVQQRIDQLVEKGLLVPGGVGRSDGAVTHYTTPEALATEKTILSHIEAGQGKSSSILAPDKTVEAILSAAREGTDNRALNAGQLAAATLSLTSNDRIVAVQGIAGAGKSTMIDAVARIAEDHGHKVIGLAFQNKMVTDLREGAGIEARTVSSFVNSYIRAANRGEGPAYEKHKAELKGSVLVLDEGSMVGNNSLEKVLNIANTFEVQRLVLVGDRKQLSAIDAGKAFSLAQASGISIEYMRENLRQQTPELVAAAALSDSGRHREAIALLGDNVKNSETPVIDAAAKWLELSTVDRENTAIFSSGRVARSEINELVQQGLRAEGTLTGDVKTLSVIDRASSQREELRYTATYKDAQYLSVHHSPIGLKLKPGEYTVVGIDKRGKVEIRDEHGKLSKFDPQKISPNDRTDGMYLYNREKIEIQEGDKVRWTATDKDRGIDNASLAKIARIQNDLVSVELQDGKLVDLKAGDPMLDRLGLAYALNMHMAQGVTVDNGIGVMQTHERNLTTQQLFHVMLTRVRESIELLTDDKKRLTAMIEHKSGDKLSALEETGQIKIDVREGERNQRQKPLGNDPTMPLDPISPRDISKLPDPRTIDPNAPHKTVSPDKTPEKTDADLAKTNEPSIGLDVPEKHLRLEL